MDLLNALATRSRLTPNDVLGLARDISQNPNLKSLDELSVHLIEGLCKFVKVLGEPIRVPATVVQMRRAA